MIFEKGKRNSPHDCLAIRVPRLLKTNETEVKEAFPSIIFL